MTEECEYDGDEKEGHSSKCGYIYVTDIQPNTRKHPPSLLRGEFARAPTDSRVPPGHQLEHSSLASAAMR